MGAPHNQAAIIGAVVILVDEVKVAVVKTLVPQAKRVTRLVRYGVADLVGGARRAIEEIWKGIGDVGIGIRETIDAGSYAAVLFAEERRAAYDDPQIVRCV